jgi:hypothetical protein
MSYTAYANYVIWFSDQIEYNAAIALAGGNGFGHCPLTAASTFGITWPLVGGGPITGTKGIYGSMPYGIPAVPGLGYEISHPQPSGYYLKSDVDFVDVPGQVGNPPQAGGQTLHLVWWGVILFQSNDVAGVPPTVPIPQRRWITGFETSGNFEEGAYTTGLSQAGSRVASRTGEGMGIAIRGSNISLAYQDRYTDQFRTGLTPKTSWERFYVRVNNLGTNEYIVWRAYAYNPTNQAIDIRIDTSGTVLIYNGSVGGQTLLHTSSFTFTLGKWYLFDVLIKFAADVADTGRFRLYINHVPTVDVTDNSGTGIDNATYHRHSFLGQISAQETLWSIDVDDWICADVPELLGVESLNSLDWIYGSHIRVQRTSSGTLTDYTGTIEMINQFMGPRNSDQSAPVSTTALATIEVLSEETDEYGMPGGIIGPVAFWAGFNVFQGAGGAGRVGYSIAGGAYVYKATAYSGDYNWGGILYNPTGLTVPTSIVPVKFILEHPNSAVSQTVFGGLVAIEYIGVWGKEDDPTFPIDLSNNLFHHNAKYQNSMWALPPAFSGVPDGPVFAVGGTYVGNDGTTTIDLPAPAHFIWIRGLSGGAGVGAKSFGAGWVANKGLTQEVANNYLSRCWMDNTGQTKFTVTGLAPNINKAGVTYQYIAFCDPGTRFTLDGVFNYPAALSSAIISLFDPNFTPQAGFTQTEYLSSVGGTNVLNYKGPGFAGITGGILNGTAQNNWGSFAIGSLLLDSNNVVANRNQANYSLWRTTDPYGFVAVQITSYVGDANAFRVINLPLTTGRWPLFALVVPHNANSIFRDPSHTGNNSSVVNTVATNITTGIIAGGPDQIYVGSTLNANGIIYDVFVILGDTAGWNNGDFYPPSGPTTGPWVNAPYNPSGVGEGGLDFNGQPAFLVVKNLSGIYTLVPNKRNDTFYTGNNTETVDVKIADPLFKTGYVGG